MNLDDVTLQVELEALDALYKQNESKSDDIMNAIRERQTAIRRALAHAEVDQMMVDFLGLEYTPNTQPEPAPTVNVQGELPYEGTHNV